ncbi:MAG: Ig-like domain repeat protein [Acidimicrobiales bacterium]
MRASLWAKSAVLTAISLLALGAPLMVGVSAASGPTNPPWEPDANAAPPYGNLVFYAADGKEVTSGTNLSSPFAFAVAVTAADTGATKATVNFYNPQPGVVPANWTGTAETGPTTFSPAASLPAGTPADIAAYAPTYPVSATSTADISTWLSSNIPSKTTGYAKTIQVRLTDTGPRGAGNAPDTYWETDIGYNTTSSSITVDGTTVPANGWAQLFPLVSPSTTSLAASPPSPQRSGTQVTLKATVTPSSAAGVVQFYDGTKMLGSPVNVTAGTATMVITPAVGVHSYTAAFVPNLGDETAPNTTTATIIGGSTSKSVPYTITSSTPTVTVTKISRTRLGQGASDIGVTVTGTEFVTGAKVTVAGISFSSVKVVNSTSITAKAKVASSAKVGAATITVADSNGSGSCTKCLTIVAAPKVKSIKPSSLKPGTSTSVTITGTGYVSGATVTGPTGVTFSKVKVVSSTRITATVKVATNAKAGKDLPVTVINGVADGKGQGTGKILTIT